ncbi:hypothetical protein PIB30_067826 [Stylosanthes scabra]|uniref:Uncharacterized protein n=1 Tax=Stylosanthes scabra TaxID=79078 RepID=A0ABU6ULJ8_9FABA|nr:hypothetical protein [Stylosanthes scabra]
MQEPDLKRYVEGSVLSRAVPSGGLKEVVGVGVVKDGAVPLRVTPRREGAADPVHSLSFSLSVGYVEGSVQSRAVPSGGLKEVVEVGVVKDGAVPLRVTPRREGAADPVHSLSLCVSI